MYMPCRMLEVPTCPTIKLKWKNTFCHALSHEYSITPVGTGKGSSQCAFGAWQNILSVKIIK